MTVAAPDTRDETIRRLRACVRDLEAHVAQLKEALAPEICFPPEWALRNREIQVLAVLYASRLAWVSRSRLFAAVYAPECEFGEITVQYHVSRLRRKIARFGVSIESERRQGYRLLPASKSIIAAAIGKAGA